jgi:hypothetical protein
MAHKRDGNTPERRSVASRPFVIGLVSAVRVHLCEVISALGYSAAVYSDGQSLSLKEGSSTMIPYAKPSCYLIMTSMAMTSTMTESKES